MFQRTTGPAMTWLLFLIVSLAGCVTDVQHRLQYGNLDEVALEATGKHLFEMEFGDQEIRLVRARLDKTMTTSLHCMRDNAYGHAQTPPSGLSSAQVKRRSKNFKLLMERALLPAIELRETMNRQRVLAGGCNHRE